MLGSIWNICSIHELNYDIYKGNNISSVAYFLSKIFGRFSLLI